MIKYQITNGYSKDSSQSDFPVWMDVLSGNSSDKTHFCDVIKRFSKKLSEQNEKTYFVMDSAMYTEDNVKEISPLVKWISRVPVTISELKS